MKEVRLWLDDVREPPEGWLWARSTAEAKEILRSQNVVECSLDHDLGYQHVPLPEIGGEIRYDTTLDEWETGFHLVLWMVNTGRVPAKVTIHSWNPLGARWMAACLNQHGYDCYLAPFDN